MRIAQFQTVSQVWTWHRISILFDPPHHLRINQQKPYMQQSARLLHSTQHVPQRSKSICARTHHNRGKGLSRIQIHLAKHIGFGNARLGRENLHTSCRQPTMKLLQTTVEVVSAIYHNQREPARPARGQELTQGGQTRLGGL